MNAERAANDRRSVTAGFTLVEIVVALAIMVMMAVVVAPNLLSVLDRARVDKAQASLENLSTALVEFKDDVKENPGTLSQLSELIKTSDRNSCGSTYSPGDVNKWDGPYTNRMIPETGVPVGIGTAQNDLIRDPPSANWSTLQMEVPLVTETDAVDLNARVDGDASSTGGTVRWTTPPDPNGKVTLYYVTPIKGC